MSAIAGIDQALWDIKGKVFGAPVYELMGGKCRDKIKVYSWIGGDRPDDTAAAAKEKAAQTPAVKEAPKPKNADEKKTANKSLKSRRLYRNIEERVFGGVCSGFGNYFGLDKVLFRLIFLILFILTFVSTVDHGDGPYFMFPIFAYILTLHPDCA